MVDRKELSAGQVVKAGELILLTSGAYSDYGVNGLYRAKVDFVVPRKNDGQFKHESIADVTAISINTEWVEELQWAEICGGW